MGTLLLKQLPTNGPGFAKILEQADESLHQPSASTA
jgi:hypothetical protein